MAQSNPLTKKDAFFILTRGEIHTHTRENIHFVVTIQIQWNRSLLCHFACCTKLRWPQSKMSVCVSLRLITIFVRSINNNENKIFGRFKFGSIHSTRGISGNYIMIERWCVHVCVCVCLNLSLYIYTFMFIRFFRCVCVWMLLNR